MRLSGDCVFLVALMASGCVVEITDASGECDITVANKTGYQLNEIYISDATDGNWGTELLETDVLIDNGEAVFLNFSANPGSNYSLRAIDEDGDEYRVNSIGTCSGGKDLSYSLTQQDLVTSDCVLTITNSTGFQIDYAYVSDTKSTGWGSDLLGNAVLTNGAALEVTVSSGATYDLKMVDDA